MRPRIRIAALLLLCAAFGWIEGCGCGSTPKDKIELLTVSSNTVSFKGVEGEAAPLENPIIVSLDNTGDVRVDWEIDTDEEPLPDWLSVTPDFGEGFGISDAPVDLTLTADISKAPVGMSSYSVVIRYGSTAKNRQLAVHVAFYVQPLAGGDVIVDGENGDDDTGDGSLANPYATIGKGITEATAGMKTVVIMPAVYPEQVVLDGTSAGVDLLGAGMEAAVMDGGNSGTTLTVERDANLEGLGISRGKAGDGYGAGILVDDCSPVLTSCKVFNCAANKEDTTAAVRCEGGSCQAQFVNCEIGPNSRSVDGVMCFNSHPVFTGCKIARNGLSGIYSGHSEVTVTGCEIYGNGWRGMEFYGTAPRSTADGNSIHDNAANGISCCETSDLLATNNLIYWNGGAGVWIMYRADLTLINNTIYGNAGAGVACDGGVEPDESDVYIENNIIWYNGYGDIYPDDHLTDMFDSVEYNFLDSDFTGDHNNRGPSIFLDPGFVDEENDDFHLESGSDCIGWAGGPGELPSGESPPDHDYDGVARPNGGGYDIGAYEYDGTITVTQPNGGESWTQGVDHDITWTVQDFIGLVDIAYSTDGGSTWTTIATVDAGSSPYTWTVPNDPSDKCKVRVQDGDGAPGDVSDGDFVIVE